MVDGCHAKLRIRADATRLLRKSYNREEATMRDPLIGQSLDRYRIDSLLGEGGMGAVYKGHDPNLLRDVAIKVMHAHFAQRPDFQERFLQEARTAARLDHPSVVQVHDFGQARSCLYIVMEFIPGDNLGQLLKDLGAAKKWIDLLEAVHLARQMCLTVDYVHRQGVLHRDLKPDNIMLKSEPSDHLPYRPVLTDLGLVKLAESGLMTQDGMILGTPAYMSPEQAMGETTDARSDVYSLGILLYELAVGRLPFPIQTISQAIRYHTRETPPAPRSVRPDLSEPIERVILKALEKSPANRFLDARAMAEALVEVSQTVIAVSLPVTVCEEGGSLLTQYQESLVKPRGASILVDFPQIPADLSQDRITIVEPNHIARSVAMKGQGLTIGRNTDNEIVLDNPQVSRHHVRIEFDGTNYHVIDLDSKNGTYLANVKLLPGVREVWTPDRRLRIGDVWLRLERAQQPVKESFLRAGGTLVDASRISSSATGPVGVFIETAQLKVTPGSSVAIPLIVLNQGQVVDSFELSVVGVPAEWLPLLPSSIRLLPGGQQEVTLTIQPPKSPQSRAGRYPLTIRVASQDAPDQIAEVKAALTITAYSQFSSDLRPQRIRARRPAQVTIQNQGNAPETFTLTWEDQADELAFQPARAQVLVPPGQTIATGFRATPRQRRWIGRDKTHAFSAQIRSAAAQPQTHTGEIVSRGLIPVWVLPLVLLLCVSFAAAAAIVIPPFFVTPTPIATPQQSLSVVNSVTAMLTLTLLPTPVLPTSEPPTSMPTSTSTPAPTSMPTPDMTATAQVAATSTEVAQATATAQAVATLTSQTATAFASAFPGSDPPLPAGGPIPYIRLGYEAHDHIADGATIRNCQNQPMEWSNVQSPIVRHYDIQVAATSDFADPIVNVSVDPVSQDYQQYDIEQHRALYTYDVLYYYRLRARNNTNPTSWSPPASFRWPLPPLFAPELRTPSDGATINTGSSFDWAYSGPIGAPFEGDCFHLQISTDSTFVSIVHDRQFFTPDLTYSLPGLQPGQYYWRIAACNNAGPTIPTCGPFSAIRTFNLIGSATSTPTPTPH